MKDHERIFRNEFAEILQGNFPELRELDEQEIMLRLQDWELIIYTPKEVKSTFLQRLTLPLLILVIIFGVCFLPFYYLLTGKSRYHSKNMDRWLSKFNL